MKNINWTGLRTLYIKEVLRFLKVYNQTLLAPMVTSLLFLSVFSLALGDRVKTVGTVPFELFMASGLIMMAMVQNAFANTSSVLTMGKVLGTIIDYLIPPVSPGEMTFAMLAGGITRGICSGAAVAIAIAFFVPLEIHSFGLLVFYTIFSCAMLALLGIIGGIFAESFDHMHAITSYIITPLAFLSGTFYSVKNLPEFWQIVNHFNPFFYMIDGFRYAMTGQADASIAIGATVLIASNILLYFACYKMIAAGYRLKS